LVTNDGRILESRLSSCGVRRRPLCEIQYRIPVYYPTNTKIKHSGIVSWNRMATEFWDEIETIADEGGGEYFMSESFWQLIEKDPSLLTESKNARGLLLTEFLCDELPGAVVRDLLDDVIKVGARVTEQCYRYVISNPYRFSGDMLESLINSGVFPVELENGEKTLDRLAKKSEDYQERLDESYKLLLGHRAGCSDEKIERMKALPQIQEGIAYTKGGPFDQWYKQEYQQSEDISEDQSEQDSENEEGEASTSPHTVTAVSKGLAKKKEIQVKGAELQKVTPKKPTAGRGEHCCPIGGCKASFLTEEEIQQHISNSNGKAHKRYLANSEVKSERELKRARME